MPEDTDVVRAIVELAERLADARMVHAELHGRHARVIRRLRELSERYPELLDLVREDLGRGDAPGHG